MNRALQAFTGPLRIVPALILAVVAVSILVPDFLSDRTLGAVLDRSNINGIIALGLAVAIIAGQIDLSIGSTLAVSGLVAIALQDELGAPLAALVGVVAGAGIGAINGFMVTRLGINSLVATLASLIFFRSLALTASSGQPVSGTDFTFALLADRTLLPGITVRTVIFLGLAVILQLVISGTVLGRNLMAVGGNPHAARAAGVPASAYAFAALTFSGACAGLGGVLLALTLNTGSPAVGEQTLIAVLAAVLIGGTRLEGGAGSALGTVAGVLTIAVVVTGLEFSNVPAYYQQIVTGSILLAVVASELLPRFRTRASRAQARSAREATADDHALSAARGPTSDKDDT